MKIKAIRLGIAGTLTALSLATIAGPAHAVSCGVAIEPVKICTGEDGRSYPVQVNKAVTAPVPGIGGALMAGNTLTVFNGAWAPTDARLTHQWLRNDVPVLGATKPTYRLTARDLGKRIRVATTIAHENYKTRTVRSARTAPVTNASGAVPVVKAPMTVPITWVASEHDQEPSTVLAASTGDWATPGTRFQYQWLRNGIAIPGANSETIDRSAWGTAGALSVRVTGYAPGFDPVTLTSARQPAILEPIMGAVVTGGTRLGDVLTGDDSLPWSDPYGRDELSAEHRYQWLRDGIPVPGATTLTYTITAQDQGATLVLETDTDTFDARSNPVVIPAAADLKALENVTKPVLAGTAVAGAPMAVTAGTWSVPVEKLAMTYTWFSRDGKILGHGANFIPDRLHVGKKLNVLVIAAGPGYRTAWVRLATGSPVAAPDPTQTKAPAIKASPVAGQKVTVSGVGWTDRGWEVENTFQWLRNGAKITGATGASYTPAGADLDKKLSVKVTSTLAGRTLKTQTVKAPARVAAGTLQAGTPELTGKAVRGSVLTAKPDAWTKGTVLKHRWLRNGVTIPNAYGARYQVRTADKDARITVKVTGTLRGYATESRTSAAFMAR